MTIPRPRAPRTSPRAGAFTPRPLLLAILTGLGSLGQPALANPVNPTVVAGNATFATVGKTLSVTNSNGAIINWQRFSIGQNEITRFIQASASSQVLNRVVGGDPSIILGQLQSNGRVFLVNPNGVVFGPSARVDVAGLVASTLNISNEDFLGNRLVFQAAPGAGALGNAGQIRVQDGGQVLLIGTSVSNSGLIEAPNGDVVLAAGQKVSLVDINRPDIEFRVDAPANKAVNLGQIRAGRIGAYAGSIDAGGTLEAGMAVVGQNGRIILKAREETRVSGTLSAGNGQQGGEVQVLGRRVALQEGARIDASGALGGGTVLVGGDYQGRNPEVQNSEFTDVAATAQIRADATQAGDGGKVIVWSDDTTRMAGSISARGGTMGGNGGFAEISGKAHVQADGHADLSAPGGKAGTLLLDPGSITVSAGASNAATGIVNNGWVNTQLNTSSLILATTDGGLTTNGATQDITVSAPISWSNANTLTLNAGNNIAINSTITSTGGNLALNATGTANIASTIALAGGTLQGTGLTVNGTSATLTGVTLDADLAVRGNGNLYLNGGLTFANSGHILSIGGAASHGRLIYNGTQSILGNGNISFAATNPYFSYIYGDGTGATLTLGPNISLSGTATGSMAYAQLGNYANDSIILQGTLTADQANRTFNTYGSFTNAGTLNVSAGAFNLGTSGTWSNAGATVNLSGGTLTLGNFNTANAGSIAQTGGSASLTGTATNTGNTWNITTTGLTALNLAGTVTGGTLQGTGLTVNGGSATFTGVTLDTNLSVLANGYLYLNGGLTFANSGHTLSLGGAASYGRLIYNGTQSILGNGNISFAATNGNYSYIYGNGTGATLTLGPNISLSGTASGSMAYTQLGNYANDSIILQGTLTADQANRTFNTYGSFTNAGTLNVSAGAFNLGTSGTWSNAGATVNLSGGTLTLGNFNTANAGSIAQTGGSASLTGTATNTGNTWNITTTGLTALNLAGTVTGGTLQGTGLTVNGGSATFTGVTLDTNLSVLANGYLYLNGGLTFANSGHILSIGGAASYGRLIYNGTQSILGNGNISFAATNGNYSYIYGDGTGATLTLGPNISLSGTASGSMAYTQLGNYANDSIILQGTLTADQANRTFTTYGSFTNAGTLNVSAGAFNLGTSGTWSNAGATVNLSGGTLTLGNFNTANAGSIAQTGGSASLTGTATNTGNTWNITTTGLTALNLAGTVTGGTLQGTGLTVNGTSATLTGVTLDADLAVKGSGYLYLNGGLTFANSGHTLSLGGAASYGRLIYNGTQSILGNGNISFAATNGNYSYIYGDGTGVSLTLGPNISLSGTASGSMAYAQLGNYANDSIIFQGTLTADQANRTFSTYGNFTNAGTLNVSAGIFNLGNVAPGGLGTINTTAAGVFNLTGTLDLASGSLDIAPGGDFGAKGLGTLSGTIQNGTLTGTALTSSNGTLTNIIIGNSMTESGTLSIGQNLTLADGIDFNVGSSALYFNAAAAGINLAGGATSASLTHTGTLYNNAGNNSGVVTIANGITVQGSGNLNNYYGGGGWVNNGLILNNTAAALNFNSPSFTNGATGIVSAVSGTTSLNPTTLNLLAGNTLNVAGGILNVIPTNAWTNSGNTTVSSGTLNLGGSFVLSSLGTYGRTGGTVNITGTLDLLNSLTPLNIASGGQFGTGGLGTLSGTIQNGTLTGAALTSSNGTLTNIIIGNSMTESGTLSIGQNLTLADGVDFNVGSSGLYFNAAAAGINLAAGATSASLTHTGTLYNNAGNNSGVVTIANGITVQGSGNLNNYYGGGGWVNNGLILNNTAAALNFNSPSFTNGATGIVSAVSGTTSLNPTTLNLLAGNTLNVAGGILNVIPTNAWTNSGNTTVSSGTLNLGGSFVLSSLGTYGRTGGTVNITGTLDLLNSLTPLNIASGGQFGTGGLGTLSGTIQNGTLTGAALTSSNGTLTNIIIGSSMTESGTLSIGQNLTLADGVDFNVGSSGLYFNAAAAGINLAAGATSASLTHTGTLYNNAGNNSGVVTIANGITVQGSGNLNNYYGGGGWVNNGLILNNTAAALNFNSPSFTNGATGSIEIGAAATVNASSTTFSNNGAIIISGGTLSRTTGSLVNPSGGTIKGYGTINMGANTFTNNGTVSVGDTAAPGTGMLGITGNFTQGSTGILNLDIAGRTRGSQYDALDISGAATLGGTLNVAHTGGFTAGAIEAMHVIHANSLSGTFASINQPGGYTPLYRAANMVLGIGITDINEWTNNTSGNWATTANWSLGHTPTATELAVIDRGASNPTITIGAAAGNVGSVSSWEVLNYGAGGSMTVLGPLTQTGSNLNISGGSLTSNEVPFIQTLALSSGTWTANGASTVRVLTQSGGNLAGTGTVTLTGTGSTWSGSTGTWAGGGTVHLNPGADLTLSGSGSGNTFAGRTLDIAAGATVTVSGEVEIDGGTNAITNAGTLNLTGSRISHIYNAGGSLSLTNSSIINKTGAGTFTLGALDFTNIGTTNVNAGTLSYAGGTGTSNGNFNVLGGATYLTSGATMTFGAASFFNSAGTLSTSAGSASFAMPTANFVHTGNLTVSGGTATFTPDVSVPLITLSGGTLTLNGSTTSTVLTQSGGNLAGTGTVTLTGTGSTWSGSTGTWAGGGTVHLNPGADLTLSGSGSGNTFAGRTLDIAAGATVTVSGEVEIDGGTNAITNAGTLNLTGSRISHVFNAGGSLSLTNSSIINKTGAGTFTLGALDFTNIGTTNVNAGTLSYAGGTGTSNGNFNVLGGATYLTSGATMTFGAASFFNSAGTLSTSAGSASFAMPTANFVHTGNLTVSGGTATFTPDVSVPLITLSGGTLTLNGSTTSTVLTQSGGNLAGTGTVTLTGTGSTWSGSTGTWAGGGTVHLNPGADLTLSGSGSGNTFAGRTLDIAAGATVTVSGEVEIDGGTNAITNAGTLNLTGSRISHIYNAGGSLSLTNSSIINKTGAGTFTLGALNFTNIGTTNVNAGTLSYAGGTGTSNGNFNVLGGATYLTSGATMTFGAASFFNSAGTLSTSAGSASFAMPTANFVHTGNLTVSGGTATFTPDVSVPLITLSGGTLTLNGSTTSTVLTQSGGNLAGTGTVTLTGTGSTWSGSTGTWAGGGTVHLNPGADLTLSGSGSGNTFAGRTLDIAAGATVTVSGEVEIDGGTNAITNAGTLNLTGSRISHIYNAGGSLSLTNSSIINKTGAGTFTLGALNFTNIGTTNVNAGTLSYAGGTGTSNGNFNVLGGATYLTSGATMTFGAASFFNSAGTLTTSAGSASFAMPTANFVHTGNLTVSGGAATFTPDVSVPLITLSGGTLTLNGSTTSTVLTQSGGNLAGTGTVTLTGTGSTWSGSTGTWAGGGTVHLNPGADLTLSGSGSGNTFAGRTLDIAAGATVTVSGEVEIDGGTNAITNAGTLNLTGSRISHIYNAGGSLTLTNSSIINKTGAGTFTLGNIALGNTGTINANTGTLAVTNGSWTNSGSIMVPVGSGGLELNSSTLTNQAGGVITITSADATPIFSSGGGAVANAGTLNYNNAANVSVNAAVTNTGTINVLSGNLTLSSFSANGGILNLANGATLSNGGTLNNSGTLQGVGTLNLGGSTLTNTGTISPGGIGTAGTLSVTGNLTQAVAGVINLEMGGTAPGTYDVLAVSGTATLSGNGTLNITTIGAYTPATSDTFNGLTATSIIGDFATKNLPINFSAAPGASVYSVTYSGAACPGSICFDNTDGNWLWSDANNWNTNVLPGAGDNVYISLSGGNTILYSSGNYSIASLNTSANNSLSITGGNLGISGAATLAGNVSLAGGTLTLSGLSALTNLTLASGTLTVNGSLTSSLLNMSGGTLNGGGVMTVATDFNQTGGTFAPTGNVDLTRTLGAFTISGLNTSGTIRLAVSGTSSDLIVTGDLISAATGLTNGQPAIDLNSGRDILLPSSATQLTANTSGGVKLTAGRNIDLMYADSCCSSIARSIGAPGDITLTATSGMIFRNTGDDYRNLSGANVSLTAGTSIGPFGNIAATGNASLNAGTTLTTSGFGVTAASGIGLSASGAIATSTLSAGTTLTVASSADAVSLGSASAQDIQVDAVTGISTSALTATAGKLRLTNTGATSDIYIAGDLLATNVGLAANVAAIDLNSGRDILLPSSATQLTANTSGGVKLTAGRNIDLMYADSCCSSIARSIGAPGDITLTATSGMIFRNTGDDYRNLSGANVSLTAGTSIGPFGNVTASGSLALNAGTTLNSTSFTLSGGTLNLAATGAISAGTLTSTAGALTVQSTGANVWLAAPVSAAGALSVSALGHLQADSTLAAGTGSVQLTTGAAGDIWLRNTVSSSATGLANTTLALDINAGHDIILDAVANLSAVNSGGIKLAAGRNIDLMYVDGCCSSIARSIGAPGDITLTATSGMIFRNTGDDYRNLSGANVSLTAGTSIGPFGNIAATGNAVLHAGSGAAHTLNTVGFGLNTGGSLDLHAGGAVTTTALSAGTTLTVASSADAVSLGSASAQDIQVDAVTGISTSALTATAGKLRLTNTGATSDIYIAGDLLATNVGLAANVAAIDLNSGRDILLPSSATQLTANTSGGVKLTAGRNIDLMYADSCCSSIARSIGAPGDITLTATSGMIFRNTGDDYRNLSGANVSLTAGTSIGPFGNIAATGNASLNAGTTLTTSGFGVTAASGIGLSASGAIATSTLSAGTTLTVASSADAVSLGSASAQDIQVDAVTGISTSALTATAGKLRLTNTGATSDIYIAGDLLATNVGLAANVAAIDLNSGRDILLPSSATQLTANTSGGVKLTAGRNIDLMYADSCCSSIARSIGAPGDITLTATSGMIFRNVGDDYRNLSGANVSLTAGTSIGPFGNIAATGNASLNAGTTLTTSGFGVTAASGIGLSASGAIATSTLSAGTTLTVASSADAVSLGSASAQDIQVDAVTGISTSALTATAGKLRLTNTGATSDIYIAGDLQASNAALAANEWAIDLSSGRDIVLPSWATQLTAHTSGGIRLVATRNVDLLNADSCCSAIARSLTAQGDVAITATSGSIFRNTGDDYRNISGNNLTLTAGNDISNFGGITATNDLSVSVGGSFDASGIVSIGHGYYFTDLSGDLTVTSKVAPIMSFSAPTGNVILAAGSSFTGTSLTTSGSGSTVVSGGTVNINAGFITTMPVSVSSGTLNLSQPTTLVDLDLSSATLGGLGSVTTTGNFNAANSTVGLAVAQQGNLTLTGANAFNGASFDWQAGTISGAGTLGGTAPISLTGSGNRTLNGPSLALTSFLPTGGTIDLQAGTLTLNNGGTLPSGASLTVSGGNLSSPATFNNAGSVSTTAGSISLAGGGTHSGAFTANGGSIDFAGGTHNLADGSLLDGPGSYAHSGGSLLLTGTASGTTIGSSANIDLNIMAFGGTGKLTNAGSIAGSGGVHIPGDFTNLAGATANLSNVTIDGSLYNHGQFNVGGTVTVGGPVANQLGGTMSVPGATLLDMTDPAGLFTWVSGTIQGTGTLGFSGGGTFQFGGTGSRVIDGMNFAFNNLTLPNGSLTVQSGSLTLTGTTLIPTGTTLGLAGGTFTNNSTLDVAGSFSLTGGSFNGSGAINMTGGAMSVSPASPIAWTNTGLLTNTGSLAFTDTTVTNQIDNQGTVSLAGTTTFTQTFTNTGTLDVGSSTASFPSGLVQNSGTLQLGVSAASPGNVTTGGSGFQLNSGNVGGTGTINGNVVMAGGTLTPGFSPGALTINGNLTLTPATVTTIELGGLTQGSGYDFIHVLGNAALNGTLNVAGFGGFVPGAGQTFDIMQFASSSGSFGTVSIPGGWNMSFSSLPTGLQLAVAGAAPPAAVSPLIFGFDAQLALGDVLRPLAAPSVADIPFATEEDFLVVPQTQPEPRGVAVCR